MEDHGKLKTEAIREAINQRQADCTRARIRQLTGRNYPKLEGELTKLSIEALIDLSRVITDAQYEITRAKNQAIHQPWRR